MNTHEPSFLKLLDWVEGRLTEQDAATIAEAIAHADPETQGTVQWMRALQAVSSRMVLKPLPQRHRQDLVRLFREQAEEGKKPGFLRSLLATLTFDSRWQVATAGVRALNGLSDQRQVVFSTDAAEVIISIHPSRDGDKLEMLGQVMSAEPSDTEKFLVQLLQNDVEFQNTQADPLGEFVFEKVPPGSYSLIVRTKHLEIQTPPVDLNPS
ncbi:MAG: hypothetical protein HC853_01340 [Anaerolineae bacterium]|nr:hypothetical protein [Anaerolineae bacterium]